MGPIVLLAAGGITAELYRDRSVRLAPVDEATAREMMDEVRAVELLRGYRGAEPGGTGAVATAIAAMSRLAANPGILEAEINPLVVGPAGRGILAVDALVAVSGEGDTG